MKHFLPHFIQENYRHGLLQGRLRACTMFVDLSGFTRMTEKLMQKGAEGAEEMSSVLNQIFQPTVALVYEQGGFIPYFAGDSFTAIFPAPTQAGKNGEQARASSFGGGRVEAVLMTAQATLRRFLHEQEAETLLAEHHIGIKIGMSEGEVEWGIVGNRRKGYYFRGEPIDSCAQAQAKAGSLEVVCDDRFLSSLPPDIVRAVALESGFHRLHIDTAALSADALEKSKGVARVKLPQPDPVIAGQFCPPKRFWRTTPASSAMS